MKKILFVAAFLSVAISSNSQSTNYKAFKVDLTFGYAIPSADASGVKGGVTFTLEPHYRITDDIAVGVRFEGAALGYQVAGSSDPKISVLASYCATGEYYFMKGGFRPFAGAGLGIFSSSSVTVGSGNSAAVIAGVSKFGYFPRLGFETGHFRVAGEYNILPDKAGYLAFKLGFFFGGGKKAVNTNNENK